MMKSITDAIRAMTARPPITPPTIAPTGTDLEFEVERMLEVEVGELVDEEEGKELGVVTAVSDVLEVEYPGGYCVPVETPNDPV
jgi:hypothetical protein